MIYRGIVINGVVELDRPTYIRACAANLQVVSRRLRNRSRGWQATDLVDISAREGRLFAVLARHINFQIIQQGDRIETLQIPWDGNGALAGIEDNLREILSLPRSSGPPANPST